MYTRSCCRNSSCRPRLTYVSSMSGSVASLLDACGYDARKLSCLQPDSPQAFSIARALATAAVQDSEAQWWKQRARNYDGGWHACLSEELYPMQLSQPTPRFPACEGGHMHHRQMSRCSATQSAWPRSTRGWCTRSVGLMASTARHGRHSHASLSCWLQGWWTERTSSHFSSEFVR